MPNTPPPITVWAEDLEPDRPSPRTDPPRHAEQQAREMLDRVAGGTRTRRRKPSSATWWGYVVGMGLLLLAGVVAWFRLDLGLMSVPTVALAFGGLVVVLKSMMGYR